MENSQNKNLEPNKFTQPKMLKQKRQVPTWLGFVIIIVFAVVAFGGCFAYQQFFIPKMKNETVGLPVQSQQATAGWKTYTNTEYGFEFKYPTDWNFHDTATGGVILTKQHDESDGPSGKFIDFSFSVCKLADEACLAKKQDFDKTTSFYSENQDVSLNLGGMTGSQWVMAAAAYAYTAGVEKNGNFYVFGSNVDEYKTRYPNTMSDVQVKKILDSVKFTTPDQTIDSRINPDGYYGCPSDKNAIGSSNQCKVDELTIPSINGFSYDDARKKLMQTGWNPLRTIPNNPSDEEMWLIRNGNGGIFFDRGYYEIEACAGTGLAPCTFNFSDKCGNKLRVITAGEEGSLQGEYHASVICVDFIKVK